MRLRLVAVLVALAWVAVLIPDASGAAAENRARCAQLRRAPGSSNGRGRLGVILVHGLSGGPGDFGTRQGDGSSMVDSLTSARGINVYVFDYSRWSESWVTDPHIGPALARAIVCVAQRSRGRVVVVAHSMGGLAARLAQSVAVDGSRAAEHLAEVVAIGTPFLGSQLLGRDGGFTGTVIEEFADALRDACHRDGPLRPRRGICELVDASGTPAVRAMVPGSSELEALPAWDAGVAVQTLAADVAVKFDVVGFSRSVSVGDFAVSIESATADASRGTRPFVARCRASVLSVLSAVDESPCSHANELSNDRIVREVRSLVRDRVRLESALVAS